MLHLSKTFQNNRYRVHFWKRVALKRLLYSINYLKVLDLNSIAFLCLSFSLVKWLLEINCLATCHVNQHIYFFNEGRIRVLLLEVLYKKYL